MSAVPPRLQVPLILETPVRTPDGMGGFVLDWQPVGKLWAEMRAGSGGEKFAEVGTTSVVTWRITVRGVREGDPRRPRPDQRLRSGGRLFRILAVAERDPQGRHLVCNAQEEKLG